MPHKRRHRNQHCAVRQTLLAVAGGQKRRNKSTRKCERKLGCTVEQLVTYLGFQDNDKRHLDHIIPLSQGGSEHFTNLRLLSEHTHMQRKSAPTSEEIAAVALLELRYLASSI